MGEKSVPILLRVSEVSRLLGLSRPGIYKLLATNQLPVVRIGKSVRVPAGALDAWVQARTTAAGATRQEA